MFTIPQRRATLVALLSLLIFGSAGASDKPERRNESDLKSCNHRISNSVEWRKVVTNIIDSAASESIVTDTVQAYVDVGHADKPKPSSPEADTTNELQLRRRNTPSEAEAAQITSPPILPRQDQSQIDQLNARIQSLQESAQQALQALSAASRSVSQESQQLSQSSQQLSQDSSRLSASSLSLAFALSLAQNSEASLTGALSAAVSSGNSAFASCTVSASSALAVASGDAVTKVGAALAQATNARAQADQEVNKAQSSAVSITQAAAIIVGAAVGSSIITIMIVLLVLRYRRKRRREREIQAEDARGGSMHKGPRPGTSGSYSSLETMTVAPRDVKDPPPMTGSTAVATSTVPERFQSVRIVDVSRNGSKNSATTRARTKPESFLGERLSRLGITRRPTGEALTTDYVQRADSVRKPVQSFMSDDSPPAPQQASRKEPPDPFGASNKTTPTFSVFPKIDPDPKGTHMLKTVREEERQSRPPSSGKALQEWLQTAEISPFGPLEPPPAKLSSAVVDNNARKAAEVKWPLQESRASPDSLGRSRTDASERSSQVGTIPVAMVRENPAAAGTPQVMRGPGLPGSVRKVTSGPSVRDVSAKGREQRLGG